MPSGDEPLSSRLKSPWASIFDELGLWAGNRRDLSAGATNNLKKLVHKSVLQNLEYGALPVNLGHDFDEWRFHRDRDIYISGSVTDQGRSDSVILVERDDATAAALQGLILLSELPDGNYPRADRFRRQAAEQLGEWTRGVTETLERPPGTAASQAIIGLVLCATIAGACEEAADAHGYLAALFATNAESADYSQRSAKWQALVADGSSTHRRLRPIVQAHFGEARGSGAVRAVRADLALKVIQDFIESWRLESSDSATDRFMRSAPKAVDEEWEVLGNLAIGSVPLIDGSRSWADQTSRILELVEAAHRSGRLGDHDAASDLKALASNSDEKSHRLLLGAAELVGTEPSFHERLQTVASRLPDTVRQVSRFATRAQRAMDDLARDLDERRADDSEEENLEDVSTGVSDAATRLLSAVEELTT